MIFNSLTFLLFFSFVFLSYWCLANASIKWQNLLILISSYIFYGWWDWRFLSLIILSTIVDYYAGIRIEEAGSSNEKKKYLLLSITVNIGILFIFKYFNFFITSFAELLLYFGFSADTKTLSIILPVGISFYTFQTLSYSIDIYRGKIRHTRDCIAFAAFVAFFPQLVAGPIERASHLLPQFLRKRTFDDETAIMGISLMAYGYFKKVVIADRLAIYVNSVFSDIQHANTLSLSIGIVFFSFQIYADFSGYSLIARGSAKLLGFDLMTNFDKPYMACTISEFWKRWHISLSTWFRDYLYIPLGGNRVTELRRCLNVLVVFVISGLWHGANWTFVVWGFLHGIYHALYIFYKKFINPENPKNLFINILSCLFVYFLVTFAWIFFRAPNLSVAVEFVMKIIEFDTTVNLTQLCAGKGPLNLLMSFTVIMLLFLSYLLPKGMVFKYRISHVVFNFITIFLIILLGTDEKAAFIYFQF
jgi:D-alanyl-lipoteichoic acid acyltransferase DltB (MBOAT superfamily)